GANGSIKAQPAWSAWSHGLPLDLSYPLMASPVAFLQPVGTILMGIDRLVVWTGNWVLGALDTVFDFLEFLGQTVTAGWKFYRHPHFTVEQLYTIGISSIPLVATTSLFTGAVTAWQAAYLFSDYIPL